MLQVSEFTGHTPAPSTISVSGTTCSMISVKSRHLAGLRAMCALFNSEYFFAQKIIPPEIQKEMLQGYHFDKHNYRLDLFLPVTGERATCCGG